MKDLRILTSLLASQSISQPLFGPHCHREQNKVNSWTTMKYSLKRDFAKFLSVWNIERERWVLRLQKHVLLTPLMLSVLGLKVELSWLQAISASAARGRTAAKIHNSFSLLRKYAKPPGTNENIYHQHWLEIQMKCGKFFLKGPVCRP